MKLELDGLTPRELTLRIVWIAIRLLLVLTLIARGSYFFYQGF